ncbi:hypothetical protein [Treponema sp.]|uniref:hypothetical protein n=1 Tax=Treponema sp. TaxID=166 RepID=UPI00298EA869|nr:hypothetical protein [Treponema sp.]MCR5614090.1 hypothetical protein [Treponema sp.]
MTLYEKFDELISRHYITILDSSDWCKVAFRKSGFTEEDENTRLFFLLLDKNIPLKVRIVTHGKNLKTDYAIAVAVYENVFQGEIIPNKYEEILIKHTEAIINIFKKYEIIEYEYSALKERHFISDLEHAVISMLEVYTTDILSHYEKMEAYLKDVSGNEISEYDIQSFIIFMRALNTKNIALSLSNERCLYFMRVLEKALKKLRLCYEPLYNRSKWY